MKAALAAGLTGLAVMTLLSAVIASKNAEEARLRADLGQARAVVAQAEACDAALKSGDRFGQAAACSFAVKTVTAERDARAGEAARDRQLLADVRKDQAAAIARAEARGRTQTQRTLNAQTRLDAAPRTNAGLGRCDADCLSRLGRP